MFDDLTFDQLVPDRIVKRELGNISNMTIWRYDRFPDRAPPGWPPAIKVGSRNYRSRKSFEAMKRGLEKAARVDARKRVRTSAPMAMAALSEVCLTGDE